MSSPTKFVLDESRCRALVQHRRRPAEAAAAGAASGHAAADRPGRSGAAVPDGADHAGGVRPSARSRSPSRCARSTASGGRRRCTRAGGWKRRSARRRSIYYKYEGVSPAGSHKPNTAVPQAFYNKQAGVKRLATETGAGQWGSALAFAGALFGIEVQVFMVRVSYNQKPYRRALMETYGARCVASRRRKETDVGPRDPGAAPDQHRQPRHRHLRGGGGGGHDDDTKYALGSVLNHVLLHQTVIGQEAMQAAGDGRRLSGRHRRLHRRRLELRRHRLPVHRRAAARRQEAPHRRGRAGRLPEPDARQVRLRLRRHRRT